MQRLEVSGAVGPIYGSLGVKRLMIINYFEVNWPIPVSCDLSSESTVALLLGSRVRVPLEAWMFVSHVCCVLCR